VADQTLAKLDAQKEQLKRSEGGLDDINSSMTRSERLIKGMKSIGGALTNWISGASKDQPSSSSVAYPSDKTDADKEHAAEAKKNLDSIRSRVSTLKREGILFEYSGKLMRSWTQRYFVLADGNIAYYKDEQSYRDSERPVQLASMEGGKLKFVDDVSNGRQFCFSIIWEKHGMTWTLSANTDKEKRDWLSMLRLMDRSASSKSTAPEDFNLTRIQKPREQMTEEEKFLDDIDRAREEEDGKLDQLAGLVDGLKFRAQDLGAELESQNQMIKRIDNKLDSTNSRIKHNNKDLQTLVKS